LIEKPTDLHLKPIISKTMPKPDAKKLGAAQTKDLLALLKQRFESHMNRHPGMAWTDVQRTLDANPSALWTLSEMERTGGEPDVVGQEGKKGAVTFYDCAAESPKGRRSLCYDRAALDSRKENKPLDNACDVAAAMGVTLLTEEEYRALQDIEPVDLKTSSWILAPAAIRKLGGAVFCDRRYNTVFLYHNGAESYYASRGFRGALRVGS
jgi:hypothetical protein